MRRATIAMLAVAALAVSSAAHADPGGTIKGVVTWKGAAPARAPLDRASDPVCARTPRDAEDIVVERGKVRDVLVRIRNGTAGTHAAPATPAVLVQDQCMYAPRVLGVMAGQTLEVRNADPTFHNVRGNRGGKIAFNLAQPAQAAPLLRKDVGAAGDVIDLHCDVHPWMQAWVAVQDHPYFTVTGADGAFTIAGVPPGTYTLEAWHPVLGLTSTKIRVKKGKPTKASFALSAPKAPVPAP